MCLQALYRLRIEGQSFTLTSQDFNSFKATYSLCKRTQERSFGRIDQRPNLAAGRSRFAYLSRRAPSCLDPHITWYRSGTAHMRKVQVHCCKAHPSKRRAPRPYVSPRG